MEEEIIKFVQEHTKNFDESHDYKHALTVYNTSVKIMDSLETKYDHEILMFAALLHDVCDHKYPESIPKNKLELFIRSYMFDKTDIIMKIIDNISYSKEVANKREFLGQTYNIYLDVISDADKIEALGKRGIERCEQFTIRHNGKRPDDIIKHCHEKLLRLYPENFIKTSLGRKIAEPLHQETVEYVEKNKIEK